MTAQPKILVFASGSATGGGSGFENLVRCSRAGVLRAEIVGVVSSREMGGVRQRADRLGVPFVYFAGPWDASRYQQIARDSGAGFFALSGWLKLVLGLDPRFTFNIHPGPLPETEGLYSHFVHEAALAAFGRDKNTRSAVCMHFVTPKYDDGPIFFRKEVKIWTNDSPDTLGARVNEFELCWQPIITNLVVQREIRWDGRDPDSLRFPIGYRILREYDEHP